MLHTPGILDRKHFRAGEIIYTQGDDADEAYLVQTGMIEKFTYMNGRRISWATLGAGELFGEIAALDPGAREMSCRAVEETSLICIGHRHFKKRLEQLETFDRRLINLMVHNARRSHEILSDATTTLDKHFCALGSINQSLSARVLNMNLSNDVRMAVMSRIEEIEAGYEELLGLLNAAESGPQHVNAKETANANNSGSEDQHYRTVTDEKQHTKSA